MRAIAQTLYGPRRRANGHWVVTRVKVRSVQALQRIARFPRCPARLRDLAQREIDRRVAEARRYTDADYDQVRRSLYLERKAL